MCKGSWEVYPATEREHPLDHYTCLTTHWRFPTNRGHSKEIHVNVRQGLGVRDVVDILFWSEVMIKTALHVLVNYVSFIYKII